MDRILFGDNQFFGVNHISDEKSRQQLIKFKNDAVILETLATANAAGVGTFMCTTYARIGSIAQAMKDNPSKYSNYKIYPCMPYAHKYANAVTELGMLGALKSYMPGNIFSTALKGGMAFISKDYVKMMELMVDAEMKMFEGINTPVIFLQNVVTDLLLGLQAYELLAAFHAYVQKKYQAEAGFITMNLPALSEALHKVGIHQPIICTSFNKEGFRMSGGREAYEAVLKQNNCRIIAMQIFGGGFIDPKEAVSYIKNLNGVESILFGASSSANIKQTVAWINA
ncbi:MAG: hypothetical protein NT153_01510 [Bacteroidetes bacterium]|nr:hypothetical protein [Bacteroidota bacterium]